MDENHITSHTSPTYQSSNSGSDDQTAHSEWGMKFSLSTGGGRVPGRTTLAERLLALAATTTADWLSGLMFSKLNHYH